jgi:hypothetical protein
VHLLKTSPIPDIIGQRGPASQSVRAIVEAARDLVLEAQRIYPHNEKLPQYRQDVLKECARFHVDPLSLRDPDATREEDHG